MPSSVLRRWISMSASSIHICHCCAVTESGSGAVRPSATAIVAGVTVTTAPPLRSLAVGLGGGTLCGRLLLRLGVPQLGREPLVLRVVHAHDDSGLGVD